MGMSICLSSDEDIIADDENGQKWTKMDEKSKKVKKNSIIDLQKDKSVVS
jgi:hypothetical protein